MSTVVDMVYYGGICKYTGEVNGKNKPHGIGKMVWFYGKVYEGEWKDGSRTGRGKLTYSDGGFYDGEWVGGLMHGKGKLKHPNGCFYDGEWEFGNPTDEGEWGIE